MPALPASPTAAMVSAPMSPTGAAIRNYQLQKGGAVVNKDTIDAQLEAKFKTAPLPDNSPAKPLSVPAPAVSIAENFVLEQEEVVHGRINRKSKKKASAVDLKEEKDRPAVPHAKVDYTVRLEGGSEVTMSENAYVARREGEVLIVGYPISQQRFKPQREAQVRVRTAQGEFNCFATGINIDIPEWGVSQTLFFVVPEDSAQ